MWKTTVAGITFEVKSKNAQIIDKLRLFPSSDYDKTCVKVHIEIDDSIGEVEGKIIMSEGIDWILNDSGYSIYKFNENFKYIPSKMNVDKSWQSVVITCPTDYLSNKAFLEGHLGEILFRNSILFHKGIVIHASAIECEGKGIIFSAPAGTGKSTHANLWKVHKNAQILNGDRPAIRVVNNEPMVYGTPWSGSSPEYLNKQAKLSAIVLLEQANENSIYQLQNHEAISRVMARCFLPYHDSELMDKAINNIGKIISGTPVYLLRCRPDKEAVELVYECVK
jgi:hypothetical protein